MLIKNLKMLNGEHALSKITKMIASTAMLMFAPGTQEVT
jgi:hypothetical protein